MDAPVSKGDALVRRITVDEMLSDSLIRALASPLAEGVREFSDGMEDWGEEEEFLIRPDDYVLKLGIPSVGPKKWQWSDFQEGRVFLSGQFEVVGDKEKPEKFKVNPGRKEFLRVDGAVKREVKKLYFQALKAKRRR